MIKISIAIPVYNVEKYLSRCLRSILGQPFSKECEIICVNDGSTDRSGEMLKYFDENYDNVKVIHQQNKGLSEARNTAMRYLKGKYTMFVDSDDFLVNDSLENLYNYAEEHNADVVIFDYAKAHPRRMANSRWICIPKKHKNTSTGVAGGCHLGV